MLLENMINYYEEKKLDGCYVSINSNKLLFEDEWGDKLCTEFSKSLK